MITHSPVTMDTLRLILQIIIALGIFNVWLVRRKKPTAYRPKGADNIQQEFHAYGLPAWSVWLIGGLKLYFAACLIAGIWIPGLILPAASGLVILMLGAMLMHIKAGDPPKKALPATAMFLMSLAVTLI